MDEHPRCPHGCSKSFVTLVFLKPVGTRSASTSFIDRESRALASSFGMTNIKTSPDGESVMQTMKRTGNYSDAARAVWLDDVPHSKPGWSWNKPIPDAQREAARFDLASMSKTSVKPMLTDDTTATLPSLGAHTVFTRAK